MQDNLKRTFRKLTPDPPLDAPPINPPQQSTVLLLEEGNGENSHGDIRAQNVHLRSWKGLETRAAAQLQVKGINMAERQTGRGVGGDAEPSSRFGFNTASLCSSITCTSVYTVCLCSGVQACTVPRNYTSKHPPWPLSISIFSTVIPHPGFTGNEAATHLPIISLTPTNSHHTELLPTHCRLRPILKHCPKAEGLRILL